MAMTNSILVHLPKRKIMLDKQLWVGYKRPHRSTESSYVRRVGVYDSREPQSITDPSGLHIRWVVRTDARRRAWIPAR